jgi:hypothetical protein
VIFFKYCTWKAWLKVIFLKYCTWKGWPKVTFLNMYLEGLAKSDIFKYWTWKGWPKVIFLKIFYLERLAKSDVVLQRGVLHPGLLGHIGHPALHVDPAGAAHSVHVPDEGGEEGGLACPHLPHHGHQLAPPHFQLHPLQTGF